MPNTTM
jgi:hypothetical protein